MTVAPTCTVARKRSGFSRRLCSARAPRRPDSMSSCTRDERTVTTAISAPASRPLARIRPRMIHSSPLIRLRSVALLPDLVQAHALELLHELHEVADHRLPHGFALLAAGARRVAHDAAARDARRAREPLHRARGV